MRGSSGTAMTADGFLKPASWRRQCAIKDGFFGPRSVVQNDKCQRGLDPACMRNADYGCLGDGRMIQQHSLDLGRVHVLATADDHVLLALDEPEISLLVEPGQIAAVKPAAGERLLGRLRLPVIAAITLGPR